MQCRPNDDNVYSALAAWSVASLLLLVVSEDYLIRWVVTRHWTLHLGIPYR